MQMETTYPAITKEYSYKEYFELVQTLAENDQTTGNDPTPERIEATKLNAQRMKRITRQFVLSDEIKGLLFQLDKPWKWLLLAEAWCGDGAQCIPIIARIAETNSHIELKIIIRDENPQLMDAYLTNGGRAIPKLICFDKVTGKEIGCWGARPAAIQQMVKEFKANNPQATHEEFVKNLHTWYAQDKGKSLESDFIDLLGKWKC